MATHTRWCVWLLDDGCKVMSSLVSTFVYASDVTAFKLPSIIRSIVHSPRTVMESVRKRPAQPAVQAQVMNMPLARVRRRAELGDYRSCRGRPVVWNLEGHWWTVDVCFICFGLMTPRKVRDVWSHFHPLVFSLRHLLSPNESRSIRSFQTSWNEACTHYEIPIRSMSAEVMYRYSFSFIFHPLPAYAHNKKLIRTYPCKELG